MRIFNTSFLPALMFLAPVLLGCSGSDGQAVVATAVTRVSNSPPPQPVVESRPALADRELPPLEKEEEQGRTAFQYPFPDRDDLFLPPDKKPPSSTTPVRSNEDVVLMGFANVGEARTVLRIDGIVTSLRAGESRGDVCVLAIDPPKVELQRGEHQWTESLADQL